MAFNITLRHIGSLHTEYRTAVADVPREDAGTSGALDPLVDAYEKIQETNQCSRFSRKCTHLHVLVSAHEKNTEKNYWQKGS